MVERLILIVDDKIINRKLLNNILKDSYQVLQAADGQEALDILAERKGEISAILLDLSMPILDGYEFLKIRRESKDLSSIPVIVQTQREGVDSEIKCLEDGASDFLTKPYNPKLLLNRLANVIKLRENESFITLVQHDTLTGLYNTEGFYAQAAQILNSNLDKEYCILCIDIVQFKIINQTYGESTGNDVLIYLSNVLKESLGENAIISRFTGDRFFALIDWKLDPEIESNLLNERLKKSPLLSQLIVQAGLYSVSDRSISIRLMCDFAKMALAKIKGRYGKVFSYYEDSIYEQVLKEQRIVSQMETALAEKQFIVYYQPKININTGKLIGSEALVRWIHPEDGFMSPGLFIPLFEKNGFITKLDKFVWNEACRQNREWIDMGIPVVPISVNVSRNDIYSEGLVEYLCSLLEKYNLPPSLLHIEITETAYTQGQDFLISIINQLTEKGFYIEMDDFGSGYSSLNMLSEVPVDMLKLDMLFLQNRASHTSRKSVLRLVMGIAKELGLDVIAEGVEREEDITYLKSIGCLYAQGYLYAKPMPSNDFLSFLKEKIEENSKIIKHLSFSPTQSSLKAGSYLSEQIGLEILLDVTDKKSRNLSFVTSSDEIVVISFPVYAGRVPELFVNYINEKVAFNGAKVIVVATYGNRNFDDALIEVQDIIHSKGGKVIGAIAVIAQHSYTSKVATSRPDEKDYNKIDEFAKLVEKRLKNNTFVSLPGNRPYRKGIKKTLPFYMPVIDESLCVKCNNCFNICPTEAFKFSNPELCIHCCACINKCPSKALSMQNDGFKMIVDSLEANCIIPRLTEIF